jgi:hypothetical protein
VTPRDVLLYDAKREFFLSFVLVYMRVNDNIMEIRFKFQIIYVPLKEMLRDADHHISINYQLCESFLEGLVFLNLN